MKQLLLPLAFLAFAALGCVADKSASKPANANTAKTIEMTSAQILEDVKAHINKKKYEPSEAYAIYLQLNKVSGTPYYDEAKKLLTTLRPALSPGIREMNRDDYEGTLREAFPGLNNIRAKVSPAHGGYQLLGYHTYFTESTFDIGSGAGEVQQWIGQNQSELRYANIVRVGVYSTNGLGGQWYNVPKE